MEEANEERLFALQAEQRPYIETRPPLIDMKDTFFTSVINPPPVIDQDIDPDVIHVQREPSFQKQLDSVHIYGVINPEEQNQLLEEISDESHEEVKEQKRHERKRKQDPLWKEKSNLVKPCNAAMNLLTDV